MAKQGILRTQSVRRFALASTRGTDSMAASIGRTNPDFVETISSLPPPLRLAPVEALSPFEVYMPRSGISWRLRAGVTSIGRSLNNDIVLTEPSVSRHHARITVDKGMIYLEDTGSVNGVYRQGKRIRTGQLSVDAGFKLGRVEMVLRRAIDRTRMKEPSAWLIDA